LTAVETVRGGSPTVSVVVCAHTSDRARKLLEALESLRRQSQAPHEVIIVVDHNPRLLDWARARAPNVVAIENREERGLAGARNSGVRAARGDVIAFLDDDAVAAPSWIERLSAAYRDPRIAGAGGAVLPAWERRPSWFPEEFEWVVGCSYRGLPLRRSPVRNLTGCNMSFRREVFAQVGGFSERLGRVAGRPLGCEETEFCIRVGRQIAGRPVLYEPDAAVHHQVPRERTTWRYFLSRCYCEGISKAEVARLAGRERGLASERAYALRTLPTGLWRQLRAARMSRAAAIIAGFCATVAGFLVGAVTARLGAGAGGQAEVGT
jgi:glucosyl-dolichyl phosphate glucuronosyltransferase